MRTGISYIPVQYSGVMLALSLKLYFDDSDEEDTASASMSHNQRVQPQNISSNGSAPSTTLRYLAFAISILKLFYFCSLL